MAITKYTNTCYRVYISRKGNSKYKKKAQQIYTNTLADAERIHDEMLQDRTVSTINNPYHPFCVHSKNVIKIKNINLTVTRGGKNTEPCWIKTKSCTMYDTMPPYFSVSYETDGRRRTKNFRIDNTRNFKYEFTLAVDFYLKNYPQYKPLRKELIESIPKPALMRVYLEDWLWKNYKIDL